MIKRLQITDFFFWKRLVLLFILACMLWYWYSGMMLHHVWDSPFAYKGADAMYWLIAFLKIPNVILFNFYTSLLFTVLLLLAIVSALIWIENRYICIFAGCLLLLYQILFNLKIGYHTHHLFGFQFALLPFYFKTENFKLSSGLARILVCLTYFFAGFFKLWGRAWMHSNSFSNTIENQLSSYMYFHPGDFRSKIALLLIDHQLISWMVFCFAMVVQLGFVIGFFSRRFDILFAVSIVLFHVMDWFLMNLGVFMSMIIMGYLFLLPEDRDSNTGTKKLKTET